MNTTCSTNQTDALNAQERERTIFANKVYCKACEENGLKICSWDNAPAWREYVEGKIGEAELMQRAELELKNFHDTFKKYTIVSEEEPAKSSEEDSKKERAKLANRIYKKTCADSGQNACLFHNFANWSDYVNGKIDQSEFTQKAEAEAKKMAEEIK